MCGIGKSACGIVSHLGRFWAVQGNLGDSLPTATTTTTAMRITEMSSFSLRYSDENNKVGLLFHFAKVVRIRERSSASLCNSGEDKVRGPMFPFGTLVWIRVRCPLFHFTPEMRTKEGFSFSLC